VEDTNTAQKQSLLPKIQSLLGENLHNKKITIWGLAFKPKTDDIREAPSLVIIKQLLDRDSKITVTDPIAIEATKQILGNSIDYQTDLIKSVKDADCLVIATEWPEFKNIDLKQIKSIMKQPNIVDGRNIFDKQEMKKIGFNYLSVGR
ncbi:MAG: UDP-glucose 6-dehydrogenase, partial [Erysipelotrichia bacterium]|nr:UDP-glucose 6-dehydrogenase [Erysipelotrichia bacterium]